MVRVVGLDLSLSSTGMSDCQHHFAVRTTADDPLEKRLWTIVSRVIAFTSERKWLPDRDVHHSETDMVVMEGPAFSKSLQPGHEELSGLRVMMRCELWNRSIPYAIVTPSTLKLYTAGHGKATKAQMVKALELRHGLKLNGVVKVSQGRDDMADAYALAAMGYHRLGHQLPSEGPPAPMKSLLAVPWPDPLPVV